MAPMLQETLPPAVRGRYAGQIIQARGEISKGRPHVQKTKECSH